MNLNVSMFLFTWSQKTFNHANGNCLVFSATHTASSSLWHISSDRHMNPTIQAKTRRFLSFCSLLVLCRTAGLYTMATVQTTLVCQIRRGKTGMLDETIINWWEISPKSVLKSRYHRACTTTVFRNNNAEVNTSVLH